MAAIRAIKAQLPFALRGRDSDYGREFINDHLWVYCKRPGQPIQFTRAWPYKKDDHAHIEQKNWTHVRKLVGWDRYERAKARAALNAFYATLGLFQNLFQPSMKLRPQGPPRLSAAALLCTVAAAAGLPRGGSRQSGGVQASACQDGLFALSERINAQWEQVWTCANRVTRQPRATILKVPQPRGVTSWRAWTFSAQTIGGKARAAWGGGSRSVRFGDDVTTELWVRFSDGSTGK